MAEITPATPRASADGGYEDEDYRPGARPPNEGILGGFFRRRRRRRNGGDEPPSPSSTTASSRPRPSRLASSSSSSEEPSSAFLLLAALLIALALVAGLHWSALAGMERNSEGAASSSFLPPLSSSSSSSTTTTTVFSPGELLLLAPTATDDKSKNPILVAFAGEVFDVGPNNRHYSQGGDYSHFAFRDATRAFLTGDFSERELVDKVEDLLSDDDSVRSLEHWLSFYENHKEYKRVGVVGGGAFYDELGRKKKSRVDLETAVERWRERRRSLEEEGKTKKV